MKADMGRVAACTCCEQIKAAPLGVAAALLFTSQPCPASPPVPLVSKRVMVLCAQRSMQVRRRRGGKEEARKERTTLLRRPP